MATETEAQHIVFSRDSPYVQLQMDRKERNLCCCSRDLMSITSDLVTYIRGLKQMTNSALHLAEKMNSIGACDTSATSSNDCHNHTKTHSLESVLRRFSEALVEVAGAQEMLCSSLETSFVEPVNIFAEDVKALKPLRQKLVTVEEAHELALSRWLRPIHHEAPLLTTQELNSSGLGAGNNEATTRKGPLRRWASRREKVSSINNRIPSLGVDESKSSDSIRRGMVASTFRDVELARFNLTFKLNELEARKTYELSECVVSSMYSFRVAFHQSLDTIMSMQPFLDELQLRQKKVREHFVNGKRPWEVRRQQLNECLASLFATNDSPTSEIIPSPATGGDSSAL